jgi:glycosyltransferase involved in cell wall biosynthesis
MKKLIGVIGSGLLGRDPFDDKSWSGSSRRFFESCRKVGILERAFGVEVPLCFRIPLMARNFSPRRNVWRQRFHLDINYYEMLTREICRQFKPSDFSCDVLQIGGIYNVPKCVNGRTKCYSYHDGNLAQLNKSPYMPKNISKSMIKRALSYEKEVYQGMEKIFTMSEYLKRSFCEDFGIDEKKITCIGCGINLDEIPDEVDKDYEKKNILFIGRDFVRKGGEQILRAFKIVREKFTNARLFIIGPRELNLPRELSSGVVFLGFLSKNDPTQGEVFRRTLQESSLFVMPSLYEPLGIAPLEAMVNQIPCILTNGWAFPEMVRPGFNGELVECGDTNDLPEKMLSLLSSPSRLKEMGSAGRTLVLENYTWDTVVAKLVSALRQDVQDVAVNVASA